MTFQRLGSPRIEIHRCTIATRKKKTTHRDRKAANLSRRIAHLEVAEAESFEVLAFETGEIQQQEKIRRTELFVQRRRSAHQGADAEIAFNQARQFLKQRLFVGDRNIIRHTGELT